VGTNRKEGFGCLFSSLWEGRTLIILVCAACQKQRTTLLSLFVNDRAK
jgi:hypothetical protein